MSLPPARVLPDAIPFLDPIDEICEQTPSRFLGSTHYLVAILFLALLMIGAFVKVEVVVVGTGRITTETPSIVVQPMDRSIIRDLRVKPGDSVVKGQVLATLDPTFTEADLASLTTQQRAVLAQIRRIEAELAGTPLDFGPAPNTEELLQASLDRQRRGQYAAQLRVFDQDIERLQAGIISTEADRLSLGRQFDIARDVEAMRAVLMQKEVGSKLQFMESQSVRLRTEREFQDAGNHLLELSNGRQSRQAERQVFIDEWHRTLLETLVAARTEADRIGVGLAKAARMHDLVILAAPEDGVVVDLARRSVGSVLREAEPLVTIVPSDARMIAEISIGSADVGYATAGDEVFVKVDAFPYQKHGMLKGRLLSVAEQSFAAGHDDGSGLSASAGNGAFHRARIELPDTRLNALPEGARIIPGMTLTAEIKVGSRSALSYFLMPITRGLRESLREP